MRLLSIFLLFSVITAITLAQRRTTAKPEISSDAPRQVSRGRGRTRFVASAELESLKETPLTASEPPSRRVVSRKRVPENIEHKLQPRPAERRAFTVVENAGNLHPRPPANEAVERRTFKTVHKQKPAPKPSYEVQEIVDEGINEPFRRLKKPRVLTESHFETTRRNSLHSIPAIVEAPRTTSVRTVKKLVHLEPSSSASPEAENSVEEFPDTTFKTLDTFTEDATSEKPEEEIFKTQPIVTTPKQLEAARPAIGSRRTSLRRHPEAVAEASTQAGRTRVRTRGTRIPETVFQPAVKPSRSSRRRVADSSTQLVEGTRKGPSVFSPELTQIEGRSRTGRRIEASVPEKITLDLPSRSFSSRRKSSSSTRRSVEEPRKRSNSNVQSPSSQIKSRRFQSREISFDETKLEVLPLFETEPKIVQTVARRTFRSRADGKATSEGKSRNKIKSADEALPRYESRRRTKSPFEEGFQTSATENDPKFVKADRVTVSVNVETRTQPPHRDNTNTRSSQIKESVMSEVNEITSRRTVLRRKKLGNIVTSKSPPKVLVGRLVPGSRGKKKSEVSLSEMGKKNDGSDDISEADNYPEAFKALLKAKNGNEESMASSSPYLEISTITNIVTSSSPTTSRGSTAFLDPVKDINDQENELIPKSSTALPRSTRHRFSQTATTSRPNRKPTTDGAFTSSPTPSILNNYQGKHPSLPSRNYTNHKFSRNVAFRPREGSSNEKNKQTGSSSGRKFVKNVDAPILLSTKIPKYRTSSKALNRSKYRSEYPSRGAVLRSTTNAPRYIPTIPSAPYVPTVPTVTPSRTTVFETQETKDPDLGLEVISIDQPVKGIQSANLVNGDYVSPTTNNLSIIALPLVKDGTTEKPVSIIERIINSITAISTNSPPPVDSSTASTTESASAILKLAPKKSRQQDLTDATLTYTTDTATTEKPTTIIERILSSLNAIQATDHTNSAQVRTDFNTLSFSTTPSPQVAESFTRRTTLPEHFSTSVNPLSILDEIGTEQTLEKRTIGKLLELLNRLVSTTKSPQQLVVVTPKSSNFLMSTEEDAGSTFSTALPLTSTGFAPSTIETDSVLSTTTSLPFVSSATDEMATTEIEPSTTSSADLRSSDDNSEILGTSSTSTESQTTTMTQSSTQPNTEPTSTSSLSPITDSGLGTTQLSTEPSSSTETTSTTSFPSTTDVGLSSTTEPISFYNLLSTLPSLQKFHVSPGSVSIFSANDLSNSITPDDNLSTTVTIASRANFDNTGTTQTSTTTEDVTVEPTTTEISSEEVMMTTTQDSTTSSGSTESSTAVVVNNTMSSDTNVSLSVSNRSGRLLNIIQDPVQNHIDVSTPSTTTSTTPDYFIFAVLNNNTILRKKPPTVPNKNTPFLIVGVYPNNTIVRRFPNGTVVPMEPIIRVRGFDTRENPPPLPEITSNQVTNDPGSPEDSKVQTVENDTVPTREAKLLSLDSIGTITTTKTNVASSSTSENNIHTENRFATQSTEAAISTQGTTTPTIAATTSSITTVPTSTTTDSPSSTLGSVSTPLSTFDKATFTTTETSTVTQSTSDASTVPVDMVTSDSSTTVGSDTNLMLPTLSDLFLNGRTLEAFNDIVDSDMTSSTVDTDTNYQTLQGIQYTRVLNIQDLIKSDNSNPVFRGKPTNIDKIGLTTAQPPSSTTVSAQDQSTTFTEVASTPTTPKLVESTTVQPDPVTLSNVILEDQSSTTTTTTTVPPSTTLPTTTKVPTTIQTITRFPSTTPRLTSTPTNTILSQPSPKPTSMSSVPTSTFFPAFFTTLFPNLFTPEVATTRASAIRSTRAPGVVRISAVPSVSETIAVAASTTRATTLVPSTTWRTTTRTTTTEPTTVTTTRMPSTTTTAVPTTTRLGTTTVPTTLKPRVATTTSRRIETANNLNTVVFTTTNKPAKLKELSEEQKQNLRTLQKLEEEQAALLKQLSFLTNLNFGGANAGPKKTNNANKATTKAPSGNLADRVIELALERDRTAKTTTTKAPTSIQDKLEAIEVTRQPKKLTPSIDDVLKQYNLNGLDIATTPTSSAYGKSTDAILASILKEQGIAPPTPKSLGDQIKQAGIFQSTSKRPIHKPRTTTPSPPGPLMQGLNWLLNALAPTPQPPPTRRPLKPVKPKKPPVDQELLANSPTHVTPVVTAAPGKSSVKQPANALSQEDIQKLIKQLEGLQKDPSKGALDLSQIKSIQNLINIDEGVVVMANGEHGNTFRTTTTRSTTERRQERKLVTRAPLLAVSNSVEDVDQDLVPTTSKPLRAPIGFRPVPGVDDGSSESLIRSNLITAAVNVTRAISGFLGTALQGAAHSFQSLLGSGSSLGSRVLGNVAAGSSAGPS